MQCMRSVRHHQQGLVTRFWYQLIWWGIRRTIRVEHLGDESDFRRLVRILLTELQRESEGASPIADVAPFSYNNTLSDSPLGQLEKALKPLIANLDEKGMDKTGEGYFLKGLPNLLEVAGLGKEEIQQIGGMYTVIKDISSGMDPQFVQRELELLDSILDTRAVEHHLEPSYFSSIRDLLATRSGSNDTQFENV